MDQVLQAFTTGAGMLWKALWALIFGYIISAGIQVLVTREQMAKILGERGPKVAGIAGFFGFISSSCSFAALAASRSVLVKGAHPMNSIAFLIASTNLVIELGIVLWVLLGWKFTLANFLLGVLMIVYAYILTQLWFPSGLVDQAKEHGENAQQSEGMDMDHGMKGSFRDKLVSRKGWQRIAQAFFMEWKMVWKEILLGFTIAGFISVFVPQSFWNAIFLIGDGGAQQSPGFLIVLENALVAPVVAFFTFIGSMGNVPLAAMLWSRDASFGGVVAFLGADLVAATVIWVHAKYYGWRYALYLSGLLYVCMVAAGITVHYLFALLGMIPTERPSLQEMVRFAIDYTFFLNLAFLAAAAALLWLHFRGGGESRERRNQQEHEASRARS
ncbi:permease [Roseitranquillus sediminis]|uniref:permease n=1 Tax=Roseitranquillus sediminis TaxID=2809051 RepID=UPI001D0C9305|nr:permease [Roseitranquillus sediminis]MBM9595033.1 permease [Roseitranquillus sediminis]